MHLDLPLYSVQDCPLTWGGQLFALGANARISGHVTNMTVIIRFAVAENPAMHPNSTALSSIEPELLPIASFTLRM